MPLSILLSCQGSYFRYTIQRSSNSLPATFEILAQLQRRELHDGFEFIATELDSHPSDSGLTGLPPEAKAKVLDVCYFLQHVAMLVLLDIVDVR
jgi:hypothetical protein